MKARLVASDPPATALVIDAEGVSDIDTTAVQQLEELLEDLADAEVDVAFARVRQPDLDMLERAGVGGRIGEDAIFLAFDDAVEPTGAVPTGEPTDVAWWSRGPTGPGIPTAKPVTEVIRELRRSPNREPVLRDLGASSSRRFADIG